jgi:transposase|tara:strand:+ start:220 stop:1617 length:1398 start_codon:yes stop_codon:yes gene_type:complete
LIEQITNEIDYSKFDQKYSGAGHPAYHPRINLKLFMMAGVDKISSSRVIAKNSQENVVYIYLAEKVKPNFRTISDFRMNHPELIAQASLQLKMFGLKRGLIDLSQIFIDGTKIIANVNNDRVIDKETIEKLKKYIDKQIEEGIKVDKEEDKLYGDKGMHELPDDLNDDEKRRPAVKQIVREINKAIIGNEKEKAESIKKKLEKIDAKTEGKNVCSVTDPDSRYMKNRGLGKKLSYNAQMAVDKNGIILFEDVTQNAVDKNELLPVMNGIEKDFGQLPKGTTVSADAGYEKGEAMEELDKRGYELLIPGKTSEKRFFKSNFSYDEKKDKFICPEGKPLEKRGKTFQKKYQRYLTIYLGTECPNCPHQKECCKTAKYRPLHILPQDKLFQRIKNKLQSEEGKAKYKLRKQTVETVFGDIKENKKLRKFVLRGTKKVKTEWVLASISRNLIRINNLLKRDGISLASDC